MKTRRSFIKRALAAVVGWFAIKSISLPAKGGEIVPPAQISGDKYLDSKMAASPNGFDVLAYLPEFVMDVYDNKTGEHFPNVEKEEKIARHWMEINKWAKRNRFVVEPLQRESPVSHGGITLSNYLHDFVVIKFTQQSA